MYSEERRGEDAQPLPKWIQLRFSQLWGEFGHDEFTLKKAEKILKASKEVVAVILSKLRKSGWLTVAFDEEDARKRKYKLLNPETVFKQMAITVEKKNAQN